jgi:hypothetical protein
MPLAAVPRGCAGGDGSVHAPDDGASCGLVDHCPHVRLLVEGIAAEDLPRPHRRLSIPVTTCSHHPAALFRGRASARDGARADPGGPIRAVAAVRDAP